MRDGAGGLVLQQGSLAEQTAEVQKVVFIHTALRAKEMQVLGSVPLCCRKEMQALHIFTLQSSCLCKKLMHEEKGISKC